MNFDFASMLQDPAIREKLLNNLAMSPLDPAAAMQQIASAPVQPSPMTNPMQGGMPQTMPQAMPPANVNPGVQFGMGSPGVQFPPGAMPGGPQVPGMPPQMPTPVPGMGVQAGNLDFSGDGLVPGEPTQQVGSGFDAAKFKAALTGLAGMQQTMGQQGPIRPAPGAPGGMPTRTVQMANLQLPPGAQRISLSDLIYGRR